MKGVNPGWIVAALLAGIWAGSSWQKPVVAQPQPAPPTPTYQVSAFAVAAPANQGGAVHGCYIVDTTTGATWLTLANNAPSKIADGIRR